MAKKDVIQMVDDDEVENVGIMAGFMDDFEDILEEMAAEEAEKEEGDDADMANMMNRRPDSPEILMNNLRGDIRSLDARREELADLVGYNAAAETPEGVLALLQPVLAQQQAAAAMPPPSAPPVAAPGTLPAGSSMPPADAGGIASLPLDQGPMTPPMAMAKGGYVQHFQEGSGEAGVTPAEDPYGAYPQEIVDDSIALARAILSQQPAALPDVQARAAELYPEYEAMLGSGRDAAQAQMLFDIGQAALQYAGNVGPGGQPLRGSQAARLAGAVSQLPGKIGATAAGMSKEARTLKLAAMQAAEKERAAVMESNIKLSERQLDLLQEIAKSSSPGKLSAYEEKIQDLMTTFQMPRDEAVRIVNEQVRLEPNSGNLIIRDPISGEAEVVEVDFPEPPPDPTTPAEVDPKDLSFDVGTGTGLFAGIRNLYSSTLGQLPFLPAALATEEAAQRLRLLERDAIRALATSGRVSVQEQNRILATIPQALDFAQNPETAQESLANFVDLMGRIYVSDVKYSNDLSHPKTERDEASSRARAIRSTINTLLREDASKLYFDTIDNVVTGDSGEFGDMTREQLLEVNVADLSGDAISEFLVAIQKFQ